MFAIRLNADPSRVVLRPFHLGWQAQNAPGERAQKLVDDILALSSTQTRTEYAKVLRDFKARHWQTEKMFLERFAEVECSLSFSAKGYSETRKKLIGAYFCHEYTYSAAAIMNPSIVPHPDQSGVSEGHCRFVMSVRAVGEGHISSIAFREGIANPNGSFSLWPQGPFATSAESDNAALTDQDCSVSVHRQSDSTLSDTVIFPITEQQQNGLEDLRLVRLDHGGGDFEWVGTYTAYSGSSIRSELLRTRDFCSFVLEPIRGSAGRNKGMALFPERVNGLYTMIGRQDGKNLFLLQSDNLSEWDREGTLLMEPQFPWEFIQIGNCGSPIRTREGWLVLTHGVGAMRKYALGCALLDINDSSIVLGRSREPILTAENADRAGYVPNVVYTCGALKTGDHLLIPYGISDSAIGFATASIDGLLRMMVYPGFFKISHL
ncbi:glycoside hydrolase family 130 protein [Hyphomonas sp.]|uniref:glycoside hydrolase family 130 protein n=1 Tax=Hyphomonas sp. TaxID=87 RepID=UPI00349FDD3A